MLEELFLLRYDSINPLSTIYLKLLEIQLLSCQGQFISFLSAEREIKSDMNYSIIFPAQSFLLDHWSVLFCRCEQNY